MGIRIAKYEFRNVQFPRLCAKPPGLYVTLLMCPGYTARTKRRDFGRKAVKVVEFLKVNGGFQISDADRLYIEPRISIGMF